MREEERRDARNEWKGKWSEKVGKVGMYVDWVGEGFGGRGGRTGESVHVANVALKYRCN